MTGLGSRALLVAAALSLVALSSPVVPSVAMVTARAGGPVVRAASEPRPWWMRKLDDLVAGHAVGVSVREEGSFLYRHDDRKRRTPASNEKLLQAMALLDLLGPDARLSIRAAVPSGIGHVVDGNLWILGRGDPVVGPKKLARLADRLVDAGITRIKGSVKGGTGYFARDWWAPGWKKYFPDELVALPTALTYRGNEHRGVHVTDPERRAAKKLTTQLENRGVRVDGAAGAGDAPSGLDVVAKTQSSNLIVILRRTLRRSVNFRAEVLGKRLGVAWAGVRGTIAKGASAIEAWAEDRGVRVEAHDGSGLSYDNRVAPVGMVKLLGAAEALPWGWRLRGALASPGQGTLAGRLKGVKVRAKTGTLSGVSALSGWVWLEKRGVWAEFSIISSGLSKAEAVELEDAVVTQLSNRAR